MKIKRILCALVCAVFLLPNIVFAADTVTVTDFKYDLINSRLRKIVWTFSSDDGTIARTATYTVNGVTGKTVANVRGTIMKVHYIPDGTNTPDATGDIQLFTSLAAGVNILYGTIDNVGATETIQFPVTTTNAGPVFIADETLYFYAVSLGAGTNAGILTIWVLEP